MQRLLTRHAAGRVLALASTSSTSFALSTSPLFTATRAQSMFDFGSTPADVAPPTPKKQPSTETDMLKKGGDVKADPDTHPDFQPRIVATSSLEENANYDEIQGIKDDIKSTIQTEDIVLFMKGVPEAPVCGFSKRLVDILENLGLEYTSFDALAHPVVRTYVKELSDWPTIPQLWVKGEFVGGVDVCIKLAEGGELQALLRKHQIKYRTEQ